MKKLFFLMLFMAFSFLGFSQVNPNSTYVNGYYKSNGTYVKGYYRTKPNNTINDNYSTKPNVNPYTGKKGTVNPTYNYSTKHKKSNQNVNSYNYYTKPKKKKKSIYYYY